MQAPGRVLEFWEREHEWRPIWIDGRALPRGSRSRVVRLCHWALGRGLHFGRGVHRISRKHVARPTGYPHSENMHITERYNRVDHDTIIYDMTISDPEAYARPIVSPQRVLKLKPTGEINEYPCVYSEENEFTQRIREPATPKPAK